MAAVSLEKSTLPCSFNAFSEMECYNFWVLYHPCIAAAQSTLFGRALMELRLRNHPLRPEVPREWKVFCGRAIVECFL
jgi:hypothetical protein